jgi:hypothetical protein
LSFGLTRRQKLRAELWDEIVAIARDDLSELEARLAVREEELEDDAYYEAAGLHIDATELLERADTLAEARAVCALARRSRALLAGTNENAPACMFDPAHGSAVGLVRFAPNGGEMERVPACAPCAEAVEDGHVPAIRTATVGGRLQPYWRSAAYSGYFGTTGRELDDIVVVPEYGIGLFDWLPELLAFADPTGEFF